MSDNRHEPAWDVDDEHEHSDDHDDEGFVHLGYYVRRVEGELVLVQTFIMNDDNHGNPDVQTVYLDQGELEGAWVEAIYDQGQHLIEGKSVEFIPPDDDADEFDDDDEFDD